MANSPLQHNAIVGSSISTTTIIAKASPANIAQFKLQFQQTLIQGNQGTVVYFLPKVMGDNLGLAKLVKMAKRIR